MGVTAAVVAGGALVMQYKAGKEASAAAERQATAQKQAEQARGRMAEVQAQRERIAQVRESRIRKAQIIAKSGEMGMGSSGIVGSVSSIGSKAGSNIGTINQTQTFAAEASAANQRAADEASNIFSAQQKGQMWQSIGAMAAPTRADFATIFSKPKVGA